MRLSIVVAMSENGVIGSDGDLPWHLPEDLRRFKALTMGHTCIMGRKTWETLPAGLPGRPCIVLTRRAQYSAKGARVCTSLSEAVELVRGESEVFVLGGAEIYRAAMPHVDRMFITVIHARVAGDTHFPEWDPAQWRLISEERYAADERNAHDMTFRVYDRRGQYSVTSRTT